MTGKASFKSGTNLTTALSDKALNLVVGTTFRCDNRQIRIERVHDDGSVELLDLQTHGFVRVVDEKSGQKLAPTIDWMIEKYAQGQLQVIGIPAAGCQIAAWRSLVASGPYPVDDLRARFKFSIVWRVRRDDVVMTDRAVNTWLDDNFGKEPLDASCKRPSASTVRRWIRKAEKDDGCSARLAPSPGRPRGRSQLEPQVDELLHEAALWYWTRRDAQMVDAEAWLRGKINGLNAALPDATGRTEPFAVPSKESVRNRINKLRCYETVATKYGAKAADKLFKGSGEAMLVDHPLEVVLMDATTLEQAIVFDDEWKLPACKVRITVLMDVRTHVILGFAVYAGPNRHETSVEAIIDCMRPSEYPEEMLREFPQLKYLFGRPAAILPDNEKALIGPSSLPGINEAGITVLMPPTEMPTAKQVLERFFRTLKKRLAQLPGTILDPVRAKELGYDGASEAALTLAQLRHVVSYVIGAHNVSPCKSLDGRSPAQVWMSLGHSRATPAFEDFNHVRRLLGRTHTALLSRDGVEFNGIRYREAQLVRGLLDNLAHTAPRRSQRRDGSATVSVKIRTHDGDLDSIDVFDPIAKEYVTLPSTQPAYTHRLTAWEHQVFRKLAATRGEAFRSEADRMKSVAITMKAIDELAPNIAFQQRAEMAAHYVSRQVNRLAGVERPVPEDCVISPQADGETSRADDGITPAATGQRKSKPMIPAPRRPGAGGRGALAEAADAFDWDGINVDPLDPADPETGVSPPEPGYEDDAPNLTGDM